MSTRLGVNTIGLLSITNDIRAAVFAAVAPTALIQGIVETGTHSDRQWVFFGLTNDINYIFKIQQLISGVWVDVQGFYYTFTSGDSNIAFKNPYVIQIDTTIGFVSGTNTATMDGTGGKDNWIGWDIIISRNGAGQLIDGFHYTYNKTTGVFTLLQSGDIFGAGEYFPIQFILQTQVPGGGVATTGLVFGKTTVITANYSISTNDFGNKLIAEATGTYFDFTLPDIDTVPENKMIWIETGIGNHINVGLKTFSNTQFIKFVKPNKLAIYLGKCEAIAVYKQIQGNGTKVWRVHENDTNVKTIGFDFHSYSFPSDLLNVLLLDGGGTNGIDSVSYARLYEYVLGLDAFLRCSYADWGTGNNKYKYSLKDSGTGLFHIPDTRDMFIRNSGAAAGPGLFRSHAIQSHEHIGAATSNNGVVPYGYSKYNVPNATIYGGGMSSTNKNPLTSSPVDVNGESVLVNVDSETRPINSSSNHFIYI